jgi:hypothetical protein
MLSDAFTNIVLGVVMLNVIIPSVIMLNVIVLNVVAPMEDPLNKSRGCDAIQLRE